MTSRDVLPIPDRQRVGLTTYDAKDPDTSYPPIEQLRPPAGAPNVLVVLIDDAGFGSSSAFGGPCQTPAFERLAAGGLSYNRFHTTALCSPTRQALLTRPQPPRRRHGRDHRDRDVGAGLQLAAPEHGRAAGRDAEAQRLLHSAVRQVPRGAGVADEPDGPVRQLAGRRRRLRALLRLHRRRDEPVRAGALQRHGPDRARPHAGRGLPLHRGHDRSRDRLDPSAEGADERQAVLRLLRPRRDARAPPRSGGVVGEVQGSLRRRLGRAARGDARPPEGARGGSRRRRADRAARRDPGVGRHARRPEARPRAPDGGLRGLHGAHRPPRRPAHRLARRSRDPRRHARLRDHRRQRRLRRGHAERLLQRAGRPQRRRRRRDRRVHGVAHRRLRHARRPTTTTPSAGRTRWTRPTSGRSRSRRTGAAPATARSCTGRPGSRPRARSGRSSTTSSTWRRPCSTPPACRSPRSCTACSRCRCTACRWRTRSTTRRPPSGTRRSTSRCSATAASTTRAGPR